MNDSTQQGKYNINLDNKEVINSKFVRSKAFSDWIRNNLPDPKNFWVADIDFVLFNNATKRLMFIEQKNGYLPMSKWLNILMKHIGEIFFHYLFELRGIEWRGFHEVRFHGGGIDADPDNAKEILLDGKVISKYQLRKFLSMED